jgi:membrane-anchored glycerophosphoryl diester phosphodiesterase (GDPDase)
LVRIGKLVIYQLIYQVVVLVLTLPVSTATIERAFLVMNIVITRFHNKIEDEFLTDALNLYIEREIAATFSTDSNIDDFCDMKK